MKVNDYREIFNSIAISTFKSDYLKKYLDGINHKFTLDEQVTILLNSDSSINYKYNVFLDLYDVSRDERVKQIVNNIETVLDALNGKNENYVILFNTLYDGTSCAKKFSTVRKYWIDNEMMEYHNYISIIDINTAETVMYLDINKNLDVTTYEFLGVLREFRVDIEDKWVNIPNDIKIGDTVKQVGSDTEYIVIDDSDLPENLRKNAEYSVDNCITVVPKSIFINDKGIHEQINRIIKNRIKSVDTNNRPDILDINHMHMHMTYIEKVENNTEDISNE